MNSTQSTLLSKFIATYSFCVGTCPAASEWHHATRCIDTGLRLQDAGSCVLHAETGAARAADDSFFEDGEDLSCTLAVACPSGW